MLVFVPGALELSGDKLVVITLRLRVSLPLRRVSLRTASDRVFLCGYCLIALVTLVKYELH